MGDGTGRGHEVASGLTHIVGEGALHAVKDKPALLPRLDLPTHLDQVALAHLLCQDDVVAGVNVVARGLDVQPQVEILLADGEVPCQGTSLEKQHSPAKATDGDKSHIPPLRAGTAAASWVCLTVQAERGAWQPASHL